MGRWVVTRDEMGLLDEAGLRTFVDGELRLQTLFSDLIFDVPTIVAAIGQRTLQPGDVIATGTPEGVGIGFKPPRFLRKGQVVMIEIDRIGSLRNPVA
jgi:2-keto-4-pentenoate hydratase/2-oxohepta-3-ene-1,7-dioic acid hydratase in catechol pathway